MDPSIAFHFLIRSAGCEIVFLLANYLFRSKRANLVIAQIKQLNKRRFSIDLGTAKHAALRLEGI